MTGDRQDAEKDKVWQNSKCNKTQNGTKLKNSKGDKTQKLKMFQKSKTQNLTKLKNSNCDKTKKNYCDKTHKLKLWQNSKTQNYDKTEKIKE